MRYVTCLKNVLLIYRIIKEFFSGAMSVECIQIGKGRSSLLFLSHCVAGLTSVFVKTRVKNKNTNLSIHPRLIKVFVVPRNTIRMSEGGLIPK